MKKIFLKYITKWLLPDLNKSPENMELRVEIIECSGTVFVAKLDHSSLIKSKEVARQIMAINKICSI